MSGECLSAGDRSRASGRILVAALLAATVALLLVLYLNTIPPTITWWFGGADSGELVTAAETLGVAHPTGYPLFTLLGFLSTRVPVGEIAGRVNTMNAVLAALAAGGIALSVVAIGTDIVRSPTARSAAGAVAALAVATSSLYWSQAIIAEVYALQAFLIALILLAWAWPRTPPVVRGVAHGLSLTNHLTAVVFLIAALVALIRPGRPVNWRAAAWFTGGLAAALALYALLPLRAAQDPLANWGDPDTPSRFLAHVTGRQYRGLVDAGDAPGAVRNLLSLVRLMIEDLPPWVLPAAGAGLYGLWPGRRAYVIFTGLAVAGMLLFIAAYQAADRAPDLLPVYVTIGVWSGAGLLVAVPAAVRWAAGDT
ncbi:MAG: protein O-mannosyl-transferase family, partial [Dehalococcoidia bacterium]